MRLIVVLITLAALLGCQEPFGTDRHNLAGDRILAILVERPSPDSIQPRAVLVQEGALYSLAEPDLSWDWLAAGSNDADTLDPASALSTAPSPELTVPGYPATLGLVARFASGAERRAILHLDAPPMPLPAPVDILAETLERDALAATPEELELDARRSAPGETTEHLSTSQWSRLSLTWSDAPPDALTRTRWSATPAFGTFFELDDTRTDWSPASLEIDELEIDEASPIEAGLMTFVALSLDDAAGTRVTARDYWLGDPDGPGVRVAGRWLRTDTATTSATLRGTLLADDDAPSGLRLEAVEPSPTLAESDPYGTEALACLEPVSGPFDPAWLLDGRCTRDALVGSTVVVEVSP